MVNKSVQTFEISEITLFLGNCKNNIENYEMIRYFEKHVKRLKTLEMIVLV